jgi:hypothetical protein
VALLAQDSPGSKRARATTPRPLVAHLLLLLIVVIVFSPNKVVTTVTFATTFKGYVLLVVPPRIQISPVFV